MRRALLGCGFGVVAALAGCAVGPDYRVPAVPAGAVGAFGSGGAARSDAAVPDAWWRLYDDPAAERLVQSALLRNGDLKIALADMTEAEAAVQASQSALYPTTSETAGEQYGRDEVVDALAAAFHAPASNEWTTAGNAAAVYEVDLFGRVRRSIEAARDDAEATAALRDAMRVSVVAATMGAYVRACAAGAEAAVAWQSVDLADQALRYTRTANSLGAASDFEVQRSVGLLETARAAVPPLEAERRVAALELAYLTGGMPRDAPVEALACVAVPRLRQVLPAGDGMALLRRRPDVRAAERRLAAAMARIGVAVAELYPEVSFAASGEMFENAVLHGPAALGLAVGPLISWSFPNLSVPLARVKRSRAEAVAAAARFDDTMRQALTEVEQALTVYAADLDRAAEIGRAEAASDAAYRLSLQAAEAGSASQLDVVVAEETLIGVRAQAAAAAAKVAGDQIDVFRALGGGWETGETGQ